MRISPIPRRARRWPSVESRSRWLVPGGRWWLVAGAAGDHIPADRLPPLFPLILRTHFCWQN